jgi:hypothetical protein
MGVNPVVKVRSLRPLCIRESACRFSQCKLRAGAGGGLRGTHHSGAGSALMATADPRVIRPCRPGFADPSRRRGRHCRSTGSARSGRGGKSPA